MTEEHKEALSIYAASPTRLHTAQQVSLTPSGFSSSMTSGRGL